MTVRLSRQLSIVTAWQLPTWSSGPGRSDDLFAAAREAGYEGVQVVLPDQAAAARAAGIEEVSALAPARTVAEVESLAGMWAGDASSLTLHLGTGFEAAGEARALCEAVLECTERHHLPLLVETHRATVFQDPARALHLAVAYPELRFTADLSHWYTGVELVYGDLEAKLVALEPILGRCRMIHGRISDPGCIQVAVRPDDDATHVEHFRRMWRTVIDGCSTSGETDVLPFVVELLPAGAHYARTVERGEGRDEETDRWEQADVLWQIASSLGTGS